MKSAIISIVLVLALVFVANGQAEPTLAMGAKGDAVQQRDSTTDGNELNRNQLRKPGEDLSSQGSDTRDRGNASQRKKPRLKYRDEPGCSC